MAKQWKKVQRADSPFAGNVTGSINGTAVANVYSTANKPTKSDVGLGNVDNTKFSGGKFIGEIAKSDGTSIFDPSTGNFTGQIDGTSARDVKSDAINAKSAVDGNSSITMVGGSLSIGTADNGVYPFSVDTSGNLKIKNDEFQALADGTVNCKGNFTIKQDSNGDSKIVLEGDSTGTAEVEVNGANPTFDLGGASPLGTSTLYLRRGTTSNQSRIQFRTGTGTGSNELNIGVSNNSGINTQYAIHYGPIWSSGTADERGLSFDSDGKIGMYANTKTVDGFTFGSDGTNKHVYIKDGGLSVGTTTVTDGDIRCTDFFPSRDVEIGNNLEVNGQTQFYDSVNFGQSDIDVSNSSITGLSTIYVLSYNLQMPVYTGRYYMPNASYGASYHSWDRYMTSIPTNLYFSSTYNMPIVIPKAGKILKWGFNGAGNSSLIQSCTWYLRYGTMANGATGTGTLATVGTDKTVTVSSSSRQYEWKNSGLTHTVAEDGILFPFAKGSSTSTKYLRGTFYVVIEYTPT